MTPEERARERAQTIVDGYQPHHDTLRFILRDAIADAILEAEKRGYRRGLFAAAEVAEEVRSESKNWEEIDVAEGIRNTILFRTANETENKKEDRNENQ